MQAAMLYLFAKNHKQKKMETDLWINLLLVVIFNLNVSDNNVTINK